MKNFFLAALLIASHAVSGQKYFSKSGNISFYSDGNLEKIEAQNTSASTVIDIATGSVEWGVLIQGFKFEKALMQEHFNENYMESSKFPKAKFKGKIENLSGINFSKDGEYPVEVNGLLEIHGVTKQVITRGTITIKKGVISAQSNFSILLADYDIEIPKLVADNIAPKVDITVRSDYQMMSTTP